MRPSARISQPRTFLPVTCLLSPYLPVPFPLFLRISSIKESLFLHFFTFFILHWNIFCIFAPAIRKECEDILLNNLTITTARNEQTFNIGTAPFGRRLPIFESGLWWAVRCMAKVCASFINNCLNYGRVYEEISLFVFIYALVHM